MTSAPDMSALRSALGAALPPGIDSGLADDLAVAAACTLAGGAAVLPYYGSSDGDRRDLRVREKAPDDPVTAADHASNRAILDLLDRERPGEAVLSEESAPPGGDMSRRRLWVVDPLDGTREFIDGLGEFAVMVGLAEGGRAVLGAVYRPDPGILDLGLAAGGAWRAEIASSALEAAGGPGGDARILRSLALRPLRVPPRKPGPVRFVHSRSHRPPILDELETALGTVESVPSGSVGVKCGLIAGGEADLYAHPVPYLKEWDTCAPEAVLRGAGGRVTDCLGRPLEYGKSPPTQPEGLLAGTPDVWTRTLPIVRHMAP